MNNKAKDLWQFIKKHSAWALIIIFFAILVLFNLIPKDIPVAKSQMDLFVDEISTEETNEKTIELYFYDIVKNCSLSGNVSVNGSYLNESQKGILILRETEYLDKFFDGVEVSIIGLADSCFDNDVGLPFKEVWNVSNLDYYFEYNERVLFETEFNLRMPYYLEIKQMFVRPEEVKDYLNKSVSKYFKKDIIDNLDRIADYTIRYRSDSLLFNKGEYWQTPVEALKKGHGDCEDWAVTTLSLMRAYNSSLECYNSLWTNHMSIMCFIDNSMIIYDQGNTKSQTTISPKLSEQDKKVKVRTARNNYFDEYGLEPNERMLYALFNDKDLITFDTEEDFVRWVVNR